MNLRNYIVGGLTALALGGCGSALKYELSSEGLMVPKMKTSAPEKKLVGLSVYETTKMDRNKDGKAEMMEVTIFGGVADYPENPSSKTLLVDTNNDGLVDVLYADVVKKDGTLGSDGRYDLAQPVSSLLRTSLGREPKKKELKLESFADRKLKDLETLLRMKMKGETDGYVAEESGLLVPKYDAKAAEVERKEYSSLIAVVARKVDRNGDTKADLVEVTTYPILFGEGDMFLQRNLVVDMDYDGNADLVYMDFVGKKGEDFADGTFDSVHDVRAFYTVTTGTPPTAEELKLDAFVKKFFLPDVKPVLMERGDKV